VQLNNIASSVVDMINTERAEELCNINQTYGIAGTISGRVTEEECGTI
jgi:hypothetical protein